MSIQRIAFVRLFLFFFAPALLFGFLVQTASAPTHPSLTFSWTSSTGSPTGYYLYWRAAGGSYSSTNRFAVAGSANSFVTSALATGTYYFQVTAYNSAGESSPSSEVTVYSATPSLQVGTVPGRAFLVEIFNSGSPTALVSKTVTALTTGKLVVPANVSLPANIDLRVRANGYLGQRTARAITATTVLNPLLAGDFDNSNSISAADRTAVATDYYQSGKATDINGDGITNGLDLAYVTQNWSANGQ